MTTLADRPVGTAPQPAPPAAPPAATCWESEAVLAAIILGALAVVGLWWHNTPSISGFGDWLTNAGRITGLLAGYGMVVLVALMARLPPLERGLGADRLARWHAMGGRYVVSLVVAHGLLITWGYSITAHTDVVSQTKTLLLSYPDVLMASVAGLLLVGVGVVSARAARRRMRYETWYYLHFYTYLAMALAFSHQFATGADFMNDRTARVAWSALYLAVAAAILWYRFAVPARQALRHRFAVAAVHHEAPGVVSILITGRHLDELGAEAGQFFRWRFLTRQLWWASNPYSLSAAPHAGGLRITVKDLGGANPPPGPPRPRPPGVAQGPERAPTPPPPPPRQGPPIAPRPRARRRGPVRRAPRPPPPAAQGTAHRRRHRRHAAARPVRGAARRPRRPDDDLPGAFAGRPRLPGRARLAGPAPRRDAPRP